MSVITSNLFEFVWRVQHVGDVLGGLGLRLGLEGGDLHGGGEGDSLDFRFGKGTNLDITQI